MPVGAPTAKAQPVAVPTFEKSPPVRLLIASLNVTLKIGLVALVRLSVFELPESEAAWRSIVAVGGVLSHATVLSDEVDALLLFPALSDATPAAIDAVTVPGVDIPVTATLYVVPEPVTVATFVPPAVPVIVTSPVAKFVTVSLKTTVKLIGLVFVGSACPTA